MDGNIFVYDGNGGYFVVKIRPLMDGNLWFRVILLLIFGMLKSDHWWMEIFLIVNTLLNNWLVKIRPLMDGNNDLFNRLSII